ncbi:beta-propeller domain-containing protein [Sinimarinibacterium thermocellulolyticum]|uniref:Beta-propeller domain-containing protein n=1 Tax=Sinimarinibacterium thermocellulolyticum TaxID=3170016 RepID=A0ABV2ADB5_9GAMM
MPEAEPSPAPPGAGSDGAAGPDRVSGTNVQEQGVDEADIVKADAQGRLYILSGRQLHVIEAFPPIGLERRALASLDLAQGDAHFYASDFFFDETAGLVVALAGSYAQERPRSIAVIVDVSDPAQPQIIRRVEVAGSPLQARRVADRVHRVSRYDMPLPSWFYGDDPTLAELRRDYFDAQSRGDDAAATQIRDEIRDEIGARVEAAGAAALLPRGGDGQILACDAIAHPEVTTGLGLAVVDSFDIDGSDHDIAGVINNGYLVYASPQNLYLAQSSFGWFFAPDQLEETVVYRLALSDRGAPAYRGLAKFDGTINSSYQMSEYQGALRVAAIVRRLVEDRFTTVSRVSVFDATADGVMPRIGLVDALAPGETIQSTRFIGERGYVVTFRQVDPLFAIDLSEPTAPRVASELKIPGFPSYLMPLGDELLLTIGRAGTDEQLTGGVAIQLFDTRDLENVRPLAVIAPDAGPNDYSHSIAEYDPHAFGYFADSQDAPCRARCRCRCRAMVKGRTSASAAFWWCASIRPLPSRSPRSVASIIAASSIPIRSVAGPMAMPAPRAAMRSTPPSRGAACSCKTAPVVTCTRSRSPASSPATPRNLRSPSAAARCRTSRRAATTSTTTCRRRARRDPDARCRRARLPASPPAAGAGPGHDRPPCLRTELRPRPWPADRLRVTRSLRWPASAPDRSRR